MQCQILGNLSRLACLYTMDITTNKKKNSNIDCDLHIVSFDVPYPADYGGVMDVYYRIKALSERGVRIWLHCFAYGRAKAAELEALCVRVSYYDRRTSWTSQLSCLPYIMYSRRSKALLSDLLADSAPIWFEGIHSCYYLNHAALKNRRKFVRLHNVEHNYYRYLAKNEDSFVRKVYFLLESVKLKRAEGKLHAAEQLFSVSEEELPWWKKRYERVVFLPPFSPNDVVCSEVGRGDYLLYHGNLSVNENQRVVEFLAREVFPHLSQRVVVAGKNPPQRLIELLEGVNVHVVENPSADEMRDLIAHAHLNLLLSFQPTGLKLKLLHALYVGRFCVANEAMICGIPALKPLCVMAESPSEVIARVNECFAREFTLKDVEERKALLDKCCNPNSLSEQLINHIV